MATTLARIEFRRKTAAQWTSSNEVLLASEPGVETDTGKFKLGDGTTGWSSLPYQAGTAASLAATYLTKGLVNIIPTGTASTDTAAINAALATGADVEVTSTASTPVAMATNATLLMSGTKKGQRFRTRNVRIAPNFIGDAVQLRAANQWVDVEFSGVNQPAGTTEYAEACAIRIGSSDGTYNPKNASVRYSAIVDAWKGNGIIWEQGAHVDFGHFTIDTSATYDGIRATSNANDNNEGDFAATRVSNCARYGYWLQNNASTAPNSSREHRFNNAKAFGCGTNFQIETIRNTGAIYSENGTNPDQYTSTSAANAIKYNSTQPSYNALVDSGTGNQLSGMDSDGYWSTFFHRAAALIVHAAGFAGRRRLTQTAANVFLDSIDGTGSYTTVTHSNAAGNLTREDIFDLLTINGAAATLRALRIKTGGQERWQVGTDTTAEAGSNAGSNLVFNSRADDGTALTTTAVVTRATGIWTFRRAVVQAIKTVAASTSTVTVDVSTGNIIEITLSANVTTTTFNNMTVGQRISVVWIQDATGGRTYAWQNGARFVGGTAPTAGTTAGRRDIVDFYYGSDALWHEISRSINVA